ncbi:hypothetical protein GCM10027267_04050 [Paramicrobacterium agarici]
MRFAGERLDCLVHEIDDVLIDVDSDHIVTCVSELNSEWKTNFAEGNDRNLHGLQSKGIPCVVDARPRAVNDG